MLKFIKSNPAFTCPVYSSGHLKKTKGGKYHLLLFVASLFLFALGLCCRFIFFITHIF